VHVLSLKHRREAEIQK